MPRDRTNVRRILIRQIVTERKVTNQAELIEILNEAGHQVTQPTISQDLRELGIVKADEGTEDERYIVSDHSPPMEKGRDHLRKILEDFLEGAVPSGNLVVLKVRSATAGAVASALDAAPPRGVVGTLAGDDTVIVIADDAIGGGSVAKTIMGLLEEE